MKKIEEMQTWKTPGRITSVVKCESRKEKWDSFSIKVLNSGKDLFGGEVVAFKCPECHKVSESSIFLVQQ